MALKNFVDNSAPVIDAEWLNEVDALKETTVPAISANLASTATGKGAALVGFLQSGTSEVSRTVLDKLREVSVSVTDFGADKTGATDSLAAFNAAIAYVEAQRNSGGGGVVFVPAGSYQFTDTLRVGGMVRLVGENYLNTVLFWTSAHASGHCIELGPDESGLYGFSGSHTFGTRIENLDVVGQDVDRGPTSAMIYTVGAHQFSGLFNVLVRKFRNIGVHYDVGIGGPAAFVIDQVELQGSVTPPGTGSTVGLKCSAGGAVINASTLLIQGDTANPMSYGVQMTKDVLCVVGGHFEHCLVGIALQQNEVLTTQNFIASVTGHSSVPVLVQRAATNNLEFSLLNVANTTLTATSLNVLSDLETGLTVGGTNGRSLTLYSSSQNQIQNCVTVEVTSAQLLALNATPKTIIAAPDSGFAVVPTRVAIYKPAGTAYAGVAAGEDLVLKYTNASGAECSAQIETTGFLDQAGAETRYAGMPAAAVEPVAAAAVVLHLLTGEITTGNTSIHVRVWYDLMPTVFVA